MKYILAITFLLLAVPVIKAQTNLKQQQNDLELMKKLLNKNFKVHKNIQGESPVREDAFNDQLTSSLLFETGKGKIYSMAPDKLRCLKPAFNSTMPADLTAPEIYIPNGWRKSK